MSIILTICVCSLLATVLLLGQAGAHADEMQDLAEDCSERVQKLTKEIARQEEIIYQLKTREDGT